MPRQPYSEAVPSTGGRLHPSLFEKGFCLPVRGTERVAKPIVAWLGCGALLAGETER